MKPVRPSQPMVEFGTRIREMRRQCGLTQQAVAERLQVHRTTYTKYETGCVAPDQQSLLRMAEMFGVTVDALLGRELSLANTEGGQMELTAEERVLVQMFRQLNAAEQQNVVKRVRAAFGKEE